MRCILFSENEHTPRVEELEELLANSSFQQMTRWLIPQRIEFMDKGLGEQYMCTTNTKKAIEMNENFEPVFGFIVYIGKPTGILLIPHVWCNDKSTNKWVDFTNVDEDEMRSLVFTCGNHEVNMSLKRWYNDETISNTFALQPTARWKQFEITTPLDTILPPGAKYLVTKTTLGGEVVSRGWC